MANDKIKAAIEDWSPETFEALKKEVPNIIDFDGAPFHELVDGLIEKNTKELLEGVIENVSNCASQKEKDVYLDLMISDIKDALDRASSEDGPTGYGPDGSIEPSYITQAYDRAKRMLERHEIFRRLLAYNEPLYYRFVDTVVTGISFWGAEKQCYTLKEQVLPKKEETKKIQFNNRLGPEAPHRGRLKDMCKDLGIDLIDMLIKELEISEGDKLLISKHKASKLHGMVKALHESTNIFKRDKVPANEILKELCFYLNTNEKIGKVFYQPKTHSKGAKTAYDLAARLLKGEKLTREKRK
jgi:hypothetical protein